MASRRLQYERQGRAVRAAPAATVVEEQSVAPRAPVTRAPVAAAAPMAAAVPAAAAANAPTAAPTVAAAAAPGAAAQGEPAEGGAKPGAVALRISIIIGIVLALGVILMAVWMMRMKERMREKVDAVSYRVDEVVEDSMTTRAAQEAKLAATAREAQYKVSQLEERMRDMVAPSYPPMPLESPADPYHANASCAQGTCGIAVGGAINTNDLASALLAPSPPRRDVPRGGEEAASDVDANAETVAPAPTTTPHDDPFDGLDVGEEVDGEVVM